jgi:hypothetical protein
VLSSFDSAEMIGEKNFTADDLYSNSGKSLGTIVFRCAEQKQQSSFLLRKHRSAHQHATIHVQNMAGNVGGFFGGEKAHSMGYFHISPGSTERDHFVDF